MSFSRKCMQLDTIVLSKTHQSLRDHYHMLSFFVDPRLHEDRRNPVCTCNENCSKLCRTKKTNGQKRGKRQHAKLNYVHAWNVLINEMVLQQLKCC